MGGFPEWMAPELGVEGSQISAGRPRRGGRTPQADAVMGAVGRSVHVGNSLELILVRRKRSLQGVEVDGWVWWRLVEARVSLAKARGVFPAEWMRSSRGGLIKEITRSDMSFRKMAGSGCRVRMSLEWGRLRRGDRAGDNCSDAGEMWGLNGERSRPSAVGVRR